MSEAAKTNYFMYSGTNSPSMENDLEYPKTTEGATDLIKKEINPSSFDSLINQNIIKTDDYRKIRATRREIGHVHFEPD